MSIFKLWDFMMLTFGRLFGLLGIVTSCALSLSAIMDFSQGGSNYVNSLWALILFLLFFALFSYLCFKMLTVKKVS